jgi:hypothetical protein
MSAVVTDALQKVVKRVAKGKEPDWKAFQLRGDAWDRISKIVLKEFDEMKGHGVGRPLAALQELAFKEALKVDATTQASRPLHTVALWLTDTRIHAEQYTETKCDRARRIMEQRGLLRKRD